MQVPQRAPDPEPSRQRAGTAGTARWMGWRLRLLVVAALGGCLAWGLLAAWLHGQPQLDPRWRADLAGHIELIGSSSAPGLSGERLRAIEAGHVRLELPAATALRASPRWIPGDAERTAAVAWQDRLHLVWSTPALRLNFESGRHLDLPAERAAPWPPAMFWSLGAAALALYLIGMVVVLANPQGHNLLFALIAVCQSGNLIALAVESALQWAYPPTWARLEAPGRVAFDLVTAAAIVHITCLHPRRLPGAAWVSALGWASAVTLGTLFALDALPGAWWWVQGAVTAMGLTALGVLTWSHRIEAHPLAAVLRRVGILALVGWLLTTASMAAAAGLPRLQPTLMATVPLAWTVFFAGLLALVPFVARSQGAIREFALVAGVSSFAAMLDLSLVALFSIGQFVSLTVALFLSLGLYAGARHWLVGRLLGRGRLSTERMFEHLYRAAREVEARPERAPALLAALMKDLFEPIEMSTTGTDGDQARVVDDGAALVLPVPRLGPSDQGSRPDQAIVLRFAQRGRRLFTAGDARLADSVAEQLRRAVAFDLAVEQGRGEERLRLAQDLHDDIGARLLTLMYQAPNPEMEDYLRHTLQDLKTLTRGLAAQNHRLSDAAAEWKADLTHRLETAGVELAWSLAIDEDPVLGVVQWSALTRVLRELVSNVIAHARAQRVEVAMALDRGRLELLIADDGIGRDPARWAPGLGLGGVRKRIRQLGGEVAWEEQHPQGIRCRVSLGGFGQGPAPAHWAVEE